MATTNRPLQAESGYPEAVKGTIAQLTVSENRKEDMAYVHLGFCRQFGIPFTSPCHERVEQLDWKRSITILKRPALGFA
jgi:hypothetical protein